MRHLKGGNRLSRNRGLLRATLRDLAKATLIEQRICTTSAKAKEARKLIDKLITLGKKDTLAARRAAFAVLCDHGLVSQLFKETAPRFKTRQGGYTRIIPFVKRAGDNAEMVFLELTEKTHDIISRTKRSKQALTAVEESGVSEAQTKPVVDIKSEEPKADVKTTTKTKAKKAPGAIRKMFQRKAGAE